MDTAYVGTYGEKGIYRIGVEEGRVQVLDHTEAENASYLAGYGAYLLAVSETQSYEGRNGGSALCYLRGEDGALTKLSQEATFGRDPCYISAIGGRVFAANYSEGTLSAFTLENGRLSPRVTVLPHRGGGPDPERQEMAHIHCAQITPDGKIAVCDLGTDELVLYSPDCERLGGAALPAGSGPRHVVFQGGFAYVVTELSSRVFVYRYEGGALAYAEDFSLLPEGFSGFSNAAAIKISPCRRFLTCSNRGHNSLTTFRIGEDGGLRLLCNTPCGGDFPRDIAYTPDGRYLLCANQYSEDITVLAVDGEGRTKLLEERCSLPKPVCLLFL